MVTRYAYNYDAYKIGFTIVYVYMVFIQSYSIFI